MSNPRTPSMHSGDVEIGSRKYFDVFNLHQVCGVFGRVCSVPIMPSRCSMIRLIFIMFQNLDSFFILGRKYSWQQTKTHSNPDLTRVGLSRDGRSGKSNSAEARIIKERNHIL